MGAAVVAIVGREEELRAVRAVLAPPASAAVVIRGAPGIGKTTLWEAAAAAVETTGRRLLVARPVEAEQHLALATVADLLQPIADDVAGELPPPQRRAMERALLAVEGAAVDVRTLAAALLSSLRVVGGDEGAAALAVDDYQWADPASRAVVGFALRRLSSVRGAAIVAVRSGVATAADPPLDPALRSLVLDLRPLSLGATDRILADRLDEPLPRSLVRRVHAASGGNPLYALELAAAALARGHVSPGDALPLPRDLDSLLRDRIAALPLDTRRALAAAAALAEPNVELVEREGDLQPALDARVVDVEGGAVRFAHPLFASAAYALLAPRQLAALHGRLAAEASTPGERARHLALARREPDETVAHALEAAAEQALVRGAPVTAAELLELAVDRTADPTRRAPRLLAAADAYWRGGEVAAARPLAEEAAAELPPGRERARALIRLSTLRRDDLRAAAALAERASAEAGEDADVRALAAMQASLAHGFAGDTTRAVEFARRAVEQLDALSDATCAMVVAEAAFVELAATGRADADLLARGLAAERLDALGGGLEVRAVVALQLMLEERYDDARAVLDELLAALEALGYDFRVMDLLNWRAEIEIRAGRPSEAARNAARAAELADAVGLPPIRRTMGGFWRALAAAYLGDAAEARALARDGLAAAEVVRDEAFAIQYLGLLGFVELSLGDASAAIEPLRAAAGRLAARMPGLHPLHAPILPNLIEALIALGNEDEASGVVAALEARGEALESAWALSQAYRARALLAGAAGDPTGAVQWFERALREHERTGPFERARTLLAYGSFLRRRRQWSAARGKLAAALALFEEMQTRLWAATARAELDRVGGRRSGGGLTPAEHRVADLAAAGRTNKQIAAALHVTVRTVETHLTRVYDKLDVRSRAALARRLPE